MPSHDPFQTLDAGELAAVNGGRLIANKGPDQAVMLGLQQLVKTLGEVGQVMSQSSQQQQQQMSGMMQQLVEKRRAGG